MPLFRGQCLCQLSFIHEIDITFRGIPWLANGPMGTTLTTGDCWTGIFASQMLSRCQTNIIKPGKANYVHTTHYTGNKDVLTYIILLAVTNSQFLFILSFCSANSHVLPAACWQCALSSTKYLLIQQLIYKERFSNYKLLLVTCAICRLQT